MANNQPKDFPQMTLEQAEQMREFFENTTKLPLPPAEKVQERMRELRDMGLEDIPEFKGMSSSMRQYAWTTIGREMLIEGGDEKVKNDPAAFLTSNKQMLGIAEALKARYDIAVLNASDYLSALAEKEGKTELSEQIKKAFSQE